MIMNYFASISISVIAAAALTACGGVDDSPSELMIGGKVGTSAEGLSCTPYVYDVSPQYVAVNTWANFLIQGECLPNSLAFWVANCPSVSVEVDDSGDWAVASCWAGSLGEQSGVVKTQSGGKVLQWFTVDVL